MKLQFTVVYCMGGKSMLDKYSGGIEVLFHEEDSAEHKHNQLLIRTADMHNNNKRFVENTGKVSANDICFTCVVRLN